MATKAKGGSGAGAGTEAKPPALPEIVTRKSLAIIEGKIEGAAKVGKAIVIKTDKDLEKASEYLSNIKNLQKFVKQEKDKRLNPVKETKAWIEGLFKPMEERIEAEESGVKSLMAAYHDKKTREAADAAAKIQQQEAAGKIKPETAIKKREEVAEVKTSVKTTAGQATFSKVKKAKIINPELQKGLLTELFKAGPKEITSKLIPAAYWTIDEVTLRAASLTEAKTQNKLGELITGAEVYEDTIVGAR